MGEWPSREFEPPVPEEGVPDEAATPAPEREAEAQAADATEDDALPD